MSATRDWSCWAYDQIFTPIFEIKDFAEFSITYKYNDVGSWQLETAEPGIPEQLGMLQQETRARTLYLSDGERYFGGPIIRFNVTRTTKGFRTTIEGATEEYWLSKRIVRPAWYLPYANASTNQYDHYTHHTVWAYAGSTILRAFVAAHAGPAATGPTPSDWPPPWWDQMTIHITDPTIYEKGMQPYAVIQWPLYTYPREETVEEATTGEGEEGEEGEEGSDLVVDPGTGEVLSGGTGGKGGKGGAGGTAPTEQKITYGAVTGPPAIRLKNGNDETKPWEFPLIPEDRSPGHFFWEQYTTYAPQNPVTADDGTEMVLFADREPLNRQVFGLDLPEDDPMVGMDLVDQGGGVSVANALIMSKRFENLLTTLQEVALNYGQLSYRLSFEIVEGAPKRIFRVWDPQQSLIKYQVELGDDTSTVNQYGLMTELPTATVMTLAGRGEGTSRTVLDSWDPDVVQKYEYLEDFHDAQDTNDAAADAKSYPIQISRELVESNRKDGIDGDLTINRYHYGNDFIVGDVVTINLMGIQYYDTIIAATVTIGIAGETCTVRTGTPMSPSVTKNPIERLYQSISVLHKRVKLLEKKEMTTTVNKVLPDDQQPAFPPQTG